MLRFSPGGVARATWMNRWSSIGLTVVRCRQVAEASTPAQRCVRSQR